MSETITLRFSIFSKFHNNDKNQKKNNVKNYDILWLASARGGFVWGSTVNLSENIHYYNYSDIDIFEIGETLLLGQKK